MVRLVHPFLYIQQTNITPTQLTGSQVATVDAPFSGSKTGQSWGLKAGAGLSYAITENVIARVEYNYYKFMTDFNFAMPTNATASTSDMSVHTIKGSVSLKFNVLDL